MVTTVYCKIQNFKFDFKQWQPNSDGGQKSRMPVLLKKGSVEMHEVEKASHMFVVHFEKNT